MKTYIHIETCMWIFIAALLIITKMWKQQRCPPVGPENGILFITKKNSVCMQAQLLGHVQLFATPWTGRLPGSSVHGIFQARILEWVATSYSRGSS